MAPTSWFEIRHWRDAGLSSPAGSCTILAVPGRRAENSLLRKGLNEQSEECLAHRSACTIIQLRESGVVNQADTPHTVVNEELL